MTNNNKQTLLALTLLVTFLMLLFSCTVHTSKAAPTLQFAVGARFATHDEGQNNVYIVVGEVKNIGNIAAADIMIKVDGYGDSNNLLWDGTNMTALRVVNPDARSSFVVEKVISVQPEEVKNIVVSIVSYNEVQNLPRKLQLVVENTEFGDTPGVGGTCKSTGSNNSGYIKFYATYYDDQGKVVGTGNSGTDTVNSGESCNFGITHNYLTPGVDVAAYTITAESFDFETKAQYAAENEISTQSFNPTTSSSFSSSTPSPTAAVSPSNNQPTDVVSPTPIVAESTQGPPMTLIAVIIAVVVVVAVAAVVVLRRRKR